MTSEELGSVLRAEREKRGLSLDDIAAHLKISARILRALEEGDASSLPHAVYVRGFVRSYGNYLGLDSEELQGGMEAYVDEEQEAPSPTVYAAPELEAPRGGGKIFLWGFLALCAVGLVFFWFYRDADLFSELQQARLTTAQPAPSLNAPSAPEKKEPEKRASAKGDQDKKGTAASTPSAKPAPEVKAQQSGQPQQSQQAGPTGQAGQAGQTGQAGQAGLVQAAASPAAQAQAPAEQRAAAGSNAAPGTAEASRQAQAAAAEKAQAMRESAPVPGHHKVIITALAECWIHSNADSTDTRQFSLRKGDTFALTFADKLVLKLGNAGGVRIRYNGEDMPSLGKDGQVRTLTFPMTPPRAE